MIILPINSVINPLIYDDTVTKLIKLPFKKVRKIVTNSVLFTSRTTHQTVELQQVEGQTGMEMVGSASESHGGGQNLDNISDTKKMKEKVATELIEEMPM